MNKRTKELNQINNELDNQIALENKEVLIDIICYLRGANISEYNQELVRQDLLEMTLSAQKRGENIQTVIGEDYKTFCDDIVASLPPRNMKEKIIDFFDIICWSLSALCAINIIISKETIALVRNLIIGKALNLEFSVSIGSVISAAIIIVAAFIIVEIILKTSFENRKNGTMKKANVFFIGIGIMAIFLLIIWLGRTSLFTVNIFAAYAFTLILYIAHKIFSKVK